MSDTGAQAQLTNKRYCKQVTISRIGLLIAWLATGCAVAGVRDFEASSTTSADGTGSTGGDASDGNGAAADGTPADENNTDANNSNDIAAGDSNTLVITAKLPDPAANCAKGDDICILRARIIANYAGLDALATDPNEKAARASISSAAKDTLAALSSDGHWADINYTDPGDMSNAYIRLLVVANGYATVGTEQYHNATVLSQFKSALAYAQKYYGTCDTTTCPGNWFFWDITVPINLGPALILMQSALSASDIAAPLASMKVHVGSVSSLSTSTGQNRVWFIQGHLFADVISNNPNDLPQLASSLAATCVVNDTPKIDGPKSDGSYEFHGGLLYSGGYGVNWLDDMLIFVTWGADTAFAPSAACQQIVFNNALGSSWMVYKTTWDVGSFARYVTRTGVGPAYDLRDVFVMSAALSSPQQLQLLPEARSLQSNLGAPTTLAMMSDAQFVAAQTVAAAQPTGHKTFYNSDLTVHRSNNYYMSVKMYSTRSGPGESINGEDTQGARAADGRMYLALTGTELYTRNVIGLLDWDRLPGITVEYAPGIGNANFSQSGFGQAFVGGADDGTDGVTAMVSKPMSQTLTVNKSAFTFGPVAVFLANSIDSQSSNPTETIINQWPVTLTSSVTFNGNAIAAPYTAQSSLAANIAADGVRYLVPAGQNLNLVLENRSAVPFLTMYLDHGARAQNAKAEYALLLPGAPAATPSYTVLQNDSAASAVQMGLATGIVFWKASTSITLASGLRITTDVPAAVYVRETGSDAQVQLSISDPAHTTAGVHLTLSKVLHTATSPAPTGGVTAATTSTTTVVTLPAINGASGHVTLLP